MKRALLCFFVCCGLMAKAQVYNNEWIDFSKTYYKFKVAKSGVYRIPQTILASSGLGSTPAEYFQLWRNGTQVPIYTSVGTGTLSSSDYIEFWGEMNDGKPDKDLYDDPSYQLNDKWSLETDTAMYFLTVNAAGSNFRLINTANNVAGNLLLPEPYFMYTVGKYYKDRLNSGYAVLADNQYLFSSSYDKGEGFSSNEITSLAESFTNLQPYTAGPGTANFNIALSGNSVSARTYLVNINGDSITSGSLDFLNDAKGNANFPINLISSGTANVNLTNSADRSVVHKIELTYPRKFDFNGANNFEFMLPANSSTCYLEISNFSFGSSIPVLYDLTNGARYAMNITAAPLAKVVLQPSAIERRMVLVSEEPTNITTISGNLQQRIFNNYSLPAAQGNYLIISNSILFSGANGSNPVEDYRAYRSSALGGGFNAKIYLEDELTDQFAFGIRKHPIAIRNFIRFARSKFEVPLTNIFLIGRGVEYNSVRGSGADPSIETLDLIPTFGYPASDVLLSAQPGSSIPETPIGRLSAIYPHEVADYLAKVKETEQAQAALSPSFEDRAWMKNIILLNGGGEPPLPATISNYFDTYRKIITDTLFGGNVITFTKESAAAVGEVNTNFKSAFEKGASLITYFGHSSSGTLSYNLDEPNAYNNQGKYPSFIALGCNAGGIFSLDHSRFTKLDGVSEKYVLAPQRGMINFIASSHFGIVHYLNIYNEQIYRGISVTAYGKSIGEIMKLAAIGEFNITTQNDYYSRANVQEIMLHGDPAVKVNPHAKPDYVVTEPLVKISPSFISVAEHSFKLNAQFFNIGKAVSTKMVIEVKQQLPDSSIIIVYRDTISGIRYTHSISIDIPIIAIRDIGKHKLTITVDADNNVDESFESNNTITKEFLIYEDEARPVYPYNFAIVNKQETKLFFSTANPFSESKQYKIEIDTTELFTSAFKISKTVTTTGGVDSVDPGFSFINNTVYYWRVAIVPATGDYKWNTFSFIYLQNHDFGFNQSHTYQHFKSSTQDIYLDSSSRIWKNQPKAFPSSIIAPIATFPHGTESSTSVSLDGNPFMRSTCWFTSLVFNVFDGITNEPWLNTTITNASYPYLGQGLYGSTANNCNPGRQNNFEYSYADTSSRRKMMDFMRDVIPSGSYVLVRNMTLEDYWGRPIVYASDWASDTTIYGSGKSLYHSLKNVGFTDVDSFNRVRQWAFIYKKDDPSFVPKWVMTDGPYDFNALSVDIYGEETDGHITSPTFGPAKKWKQLIWNGASLETITGDNPQIDVIGVRKDNSQTILFSGINLNQKTVDISSIDASQYPSLKLHMHNTDSTAHTPYQLDYWRLTNDPVPEGALAPNIYLKMDDTLEAGQPIDFKIAFKNITPWSFDSLKVKLIVTDQNNVQHILPVLKHRPLTNSPDTIHIRYSIDTRNFPGVNNLYVEVNPDDDQPEQYHFNNFAFAKFFVRNDTLSPLLDVTFDNVHILSNDLVSAHPEIVIKLKDESKWLLLSDTSLVSVKVRYPNGQLKEISFDSDTLRFISAQSSSDNTATINFKPYFDEDGTYELIVSGKDESENKAGDIEYKVAFQVINKAMISNMLNYPNPFTTSTAFVFTITGSEVPQNIKIQILTITGKIVREITKDELGPLHIGRNITEFKWNGTDQYGQKLGNGVYIYRVVTNLNGKSLDKYTSDKDDTDKYFNKGYGKMYLMR